MSLLNRLSVWSKLMLSFVLVTVVTAVVGYSGFTSLRTLEGNTVEIYEQEILGILDAEDMITAVLLAGRDTRQALLATEQAERDALMSEVLQERTDFEKALEHAGTTYHRPACKEKVARVTSMYPEVFASNLKALELNNQGKPAEAMEALRQGRDKTEALIDQLSEMSMLKRAAAETSYQASMATAGTSRTVMLTALLVSVVLSLSLGFIIARWFTKAISQVDEIAASVAAASQQLAAASEQLSSGAQQSASSLEETASSLEQMTATVRQNADNADQANQLANSSRETAERGGEVVANAVRAMDEINQASRKIADIITTIDEIAFQTNLLALNAAVEAARAGEQGRGFAVVAGEVRNLAQRSATAAKEIKGLIQDSVAKVETGSYLVNQSGETLDAIVNSVKRVTDIVGEIAAASREQSSGIEQINRAVAQMDTVTQSNASQTEEMSGTAVSLSSQAEELQNVVAQFNLKKDNGRPLATAAKRSAHSSRGDRGNRGSVSRSAAPSRPTRSNPTHELDLVGAGVGMPDGFEEF